MCIETTTNEGETEDQPEILRKLEKAMEKKGRIESEKERWALRY